MGADPAAVRRAAQQWLSDPQIQPLGDGHIHDTFLISAGDAQVVLQRISQRVFTDVALLTRQTRRVLDHWSTQAEFACPQMLPSIAGQHLVEQDGEIWRAWSLLAGVVVDPPTDIKQVQAAAHAFGSLQRHLQTLPGEPLEATIAGFLNLPQYLQAYAAVAADASQAWRERIDRFRSLDAALTDNFGHIHGDCKVNNLLYAASGEVSALLDFDTVMWAPRALDLGDLVRSVSYSRGGFELAYYSACVQGFVDAGVVLGVDEAVLAPQYVTYMLALRFLTDHLLGDVYFRVQQRGENLSRAEAQYQLLHQLADAAPAMGRAAKRLLD